MITFKQFIAEGRVREYTPLQQFFIMCWGKLLYIDYTTLPMGKDETQNPDSMRELRKVMAEYHTLDDDGLEEMDEWIGEGGPMNGRRNYLFSRATIDAVFTGAQHKVAEAFTLYRFDHTPNTLRPNSWISLTRKDHGYDGARSEFHMEPGDLIIDADELADEDEVIVNTNELLKKTT